jgi:hypothetical protein
MTKPPNKVQRNESELYPNAWERFEHAVDVMIKSGRKHRESQVTLKNKASYLHEEAVSNARSA